LVRAFGLLLFQVIRPQPKGRQTKEDVMEKATLLGHSSTKMTEKYAHPNLDSMKVNLQKISLHGVQEVYNKILPLKKSK
jgi:hypothetical protein